MFGYSILFGLIAAQVGAIALFSRYWYRQARRAGYGIVAALASPGVIVSILFFFFFVVESLLLQFQPEYASSHVEHLSRTKTLELSTQANILALIGYLFFALGYQVPHRRLVQRLPVAHINNCRPSVLCAILALFLTIAGCGVVLFGIDTTLGLLADPNGRAIEGEGKGYTYFLIEFYPTALLVAYAFFVTSRRVPRWVGIALWVLPVPLIAFGRSEVLHVWIPMIIIKSLHAERLRAKDVMRLAVVLVTIVLLIGVGLSYRMTLAEEGAVDDAEALFGERFWYSLRHAMVPYDHFVSCLELWHEQYDYLYGKPVIDIFWMAMPRSIVEDKPDSPNIMFREIMFPDWHGGAPFTLVGFFNVNGSVVAVALGMFGVGWFSRGFHVYLSLHRHEKSVQLLYGCFISRLALIVFGIVLVGTLYYIQHFLRIMFACALILAVKRLRVAYPACVADGSGIR